MITVFKKKYTHRWLGIVAAVFFIVIVIFISLPFFLEQLWNGKVFPNVYIGKNMVAGMRIDTLQEQLLHYKTTLEEEGIRFTLGTEQVPVYSLVTSPSDPDLTYELILVDVQRTVNAAMQVGREGSVFDRWIAAYNSLLGSTVVPVWYEINEQGISETLKKNFGSQESAARDAAFSYQAGELTVVTDKPGSVLDYTEALLVLKERIGTLSTEPIKLSLIPDTPRTTYKEVASLQGEALDIVKRAPFTLLATTTETSWSKSIDAQTIAGWLEPRSEAGEISLVFGEELKKFLETSSSEINREAQDAKFEVTEGRIAQFQASREGKVVDVQSSVNHLTQEIIQNKQKEARLLFQTVAPKVTTDQVNDLGIKEILGIGRSDFSGSPRNRRINIQVASDKLNGLLISPGDEFSLVETLKPFTVEAGYLPELVIKGTRLVPEIGGGACQIGTTTFRAALDAGLDITQRRNHSFAVSYYNDENGLPGTDATIYDPAPDFRFINDTPGHILIQTYVGDDDVLRYEFWGTNDGREASTTVPVILSRISAPETKYIETEDLDPGVTECTGSNVPGYNTTFKYSVVDSSGQYHQENFDSKYRPWQRVCLIGVEKKIDTQEEENLTTN